MVSLNKSTSHHYVENLNSMLPQAIDAKKPFEINLFMVMKLLEFF